MYDKSPLLPSLTACMGNSLIIWDFSFFKREGLFGWVVVSRKGQDMNVFKMQINVFMLLILYLAFWVGVKVPNGNCIYCRTTPSPLTLIACVGDSKQKDCAFFTSLFQIDLQFGRGIFLIHMNVFTSLLFCTLFFAWLCRDLMKIEFQEWTDYFFLSHIFTPSIGASILLCGFIFWDIFL